MSKEDEFEVIWKRFTEGNKIGEAIMSDWDCKICHKLQPKWHSTATPGACESCINKLKSQILQEANGTYQDGVRKGEFMAHPQRCKANYDWVLKDNPLAGLSDADIEHLLTIKQLIEEQGFDIYLWSKPFNNIEKELKKRKGEKK